MARHKKKTNQSKPAPDARQVLALFKSAGRPMARSEVMRKLSWPRKRKTELRELLKDLARQGKLIRIRRAYGLAEQMRMVTGTLEVLRSGQGFVVPEDKRRRDVFIDQRDMNQAWHGDKVVAMVTEERTGRQPAGRIVRILERSRKTLVAKAVRPLGKGMTLCRPADTRLDFGLAVATADRALQEGDVVLVRPGERVEPFLWEAELVDVFGPERDLGVQEKLVKANHGIRTRFPAGALAEASDLPELPDPADYEGRRDLRTMDLVTIDGATARDFDDAVHVARTKGGFELTVAIADVGHYVPAGSNLDREALERGNSYYFPASVEPMLPERLSNGLCSLNPKVDRLAVAVTMRMDAQGRRGEAEVFDAVINSSARLTYVQVEEGIVRAEAEARESIGPVAAMLDEALALARLMNERRMERGGLDFDLPEPEILINLRGEPEDIRPRPRTFAHQLIEEFMVAANEAVAEFLEARQLPCAYRVHPPADIDKLRGLYRLLQRSGIEVQMPRDVTPKALQALLDKVRGTGPEFLVNRLLLRSMKQAVYGPDNEGHFGLASRCYCHFTSPIRRYADLIVHRSVKHALGASTVPLISKRRLTDECGHISDRERVAMDAEREILKRATILYLEDRIGEKFSGVINGLAEFGFWVELTEVMAEGMVRLSSLSDDYYAYWADEQRLVGERTGRSFQLGQKVDVVLEDVNLDRLEVNLDLAENADRFGASAKSGPPSRGRKPHRKPDPPRGQKGRKTKF